LLVCWLGRPVAAKDQNETHGQGHEAEAETEVLQRPETAPSASTDEIHRDDGQDDQQAKTDDCNTKLPLGDHGAHIIAQECGGATQEWSLRIVG
jgi:hypothetical protein